jgi:hypothetical protein
VGTDGLPGPTETIVVADASNPASGYTDADYASIASTFDNLVDPTDTKAFGSPTDIDGNGHVVLFFTRAVNELTPASSTSYVAGFFYARDLFPSTPSPDFQACATSNGERCSTCSCLTAGLRTATS